MPKFVATLRATYDADDDIAAEVVADQIRLNAETDLDDDEGDEVEITQVTSNGLQLTPDELMVLLRKARNALIKTRVRQYWELAKEVDRAIYTMHFKDDPMFSEAGYSHGDFMDLTVAILERGEEPNVGS